MYVNTADPDEVQEIPARRVQGVGFGNIFAGKGPVKLRPAVEKKPAVEPNHQKPVPEPVKPSVVSTALTEWPSDHIFHMHFYVDII